MACICPTSWHVAKESSPADTHNLDNMVYIYFAFTKCVYSNFGESYKLRLKVPTADLIVVFHHVKLLYQGVALVVFMP